MVAIKYHNNNNRVAEVRLTEWGDNTLGCIEGIMVDIMINRNFYFNCLLFSVITIH